MSYSSLVIADSPLAYWRQSETSGTTMGDSSGNGRSGTYVATKTAQTSLLTGDSDSASATHGFTTWASWMDVSAITAECIIKLNSGFGGNGGILTRFDASHCWLIWIDVSSKIAVRFYNTVGSQVDLSWSTTPTAGVIYHIAATYQSGQARLYINGTQVASSTSLTGGLATSPIQPIETGTYGNNAFSAAAILDEYAVYSGELSSASIAAHAAAVTASSADGNVSAVKATATTTAKAPAVSAVRNATVAAVVALATAHAIAPSVSAVRSPTVAAVKAAAATHPNAPAVSGQRSPTVTAVKATGTSALQAPAVSAQDSTNVLSVRATSTAAARAPVVSSIRNPTVLAVAARATSVFRIPAVSAGGPVVAYIELTAAPRVGMLVASEALRTLAAPPTLRTLTAQEV